MKKKTCLRRDGYDQSASLEWHDIGVDDAEVELLQLGQHPHGHSLAIHAVDPHHHVLVQESGFYLRQWIPRRRRPRRFPRRGGASSILVGHCDARLLDEHPGFDDAPVVTATAAVFKRLELFLELLHVSRRVRKDRSLVHLIPVPARCTVQFSFRQEQNRITDAVDEELQAVQLVNWIAGPS